MMKIAKNICFYFNGDRIKYINRIITETNKYPLQTDIFIHTNFNFDIELLTKYDNGNIKIVYYDLKNDVNFNKYPIIFPYYMKNNIKNLHNDYDIFIYVE